MPLKSCGGNMFDVNFKVIGGQLSSKSISEDTTVKDFIAILELEGNYSARVNGEAADLNKTLYAEDMVIFTEKVKGGK